MIRHWLHAEPADDWEDWAGQVAQALFLEERHIKTDRKSTRLNSSH